LKRIEGKGGISFRIKKQGKRIHAGSRSVKEKVGTLGGGMDPFKKREREQEVVNFWGEKAFINWRNRIGTPC